MVDVDAVAKAIWDADDMATKSGFAWGETTRASYRRMAQAAIGAITPEDFHCASCDGHSCDPRE
jgi:hypothetical protein